MLRFPYYESAETFYDVKLYRAAREKYQDTTKFFNMILVVRASKLRGLKTNF